MSTPTASYLEAISHLPPGATLQLPYVSWEEYEQLLAELGPSYAVRISYDQGRLEIMSPLREHEFYKLLFQRMAHILAEELSLPLEAFGSTTYKVKPKAQGAEPDESFYVQNAHRVIGHLQLDLETDPPPDVVVEIDITSKSTSRFRIFAALGVPEIWRYDGATAEIYHLQGQSYVIAEFSLAFPLLSADALSKFAKQCKTQGQTATLAAFREWVWANKIS